MCTAGKIRSLCSLVFEKLGIFIGPDELHLKAFLCKVHFVKVHTDTTFLALRFHQFFW